MKVDSFRVTHSNYLTVLYNGGVKPEVHKLMNKHFQSWNVHCNIRRNSGQVVLMPKPFYSVPFDV